MPEDNSASASPVQTGSWVKTTETFPSENTEISVEIFDWKEGKHPAVVLLHGADGLTFRPEPYHALASLMAESGLIVFLVHYFEGTNTKWSDQETTRKNFIKWGRTVKHAVDFAASRPNVLPGRIALFGTSLGASLALALAAISPGIRAVVEFFGGMPAATVTLLKSMPPTLIVHGAKDELVPVKKARELEELLTAKKVPHETKIYPDEGHIFSARAAQDAALLAVAFLNKYLQDPPAD